MKEGYLTNNIIYGSKGIEDNIKHNISCVYTIKINEETISQ